MNTDPVTMQIHAASEWRCIVSLLKKREEATTRSSISRRRLVKAGVGLTVANFLPGATPLALAVSMEELTVTAAKTVGAADVSGMIWSPYLVPMQPVIAEFKK